MFHRANVPCADRRALQVSVCVCVCVLISFLMFHKELQIVHMHAWALVGIYIPKLQSATNY